jgi:hypothetical protein
VGINLGIFPALGSQEDVLRGLNPLHCKDGVPTEACFILKPNHPMDDGISFGILRANGAEAEGKPFGAAYGISPEVLTGLMPQPGYGVARLNVGSALEPVQGGPVTFLQREAVEWENYRSAHAMMTGYQTITNKERKELGRHLTRLACQAVLIPPTAAIIG